MTPVISMRCRLPLGPLPWRFFTIQRFLSPFLLLSRHLILRDVRPLSIATFPHEHSQRRFGKQPIVMTLTQMIEIPESNNFLCFHDDPRTD